MINKILFIISLIAVILVWIFFSFFWPAGSKSGQISPDKNNQVENINIAEKASGTKKIKFDNHLPDDIGNANRKINFLFFGDLMLDRHVGEKIAKSGLDSLFSKLSTSTQNIFLNKDLIGANLEGAVTDKGAHYPPNNAYDFAFAPDLINSLKKYNYNFFNLANNHLADQGERGIIETRNNLEKMFFDFSGCKDSETGECSYKVIKAKGYKVAMIGFSMVYKKFDLKAAASLINNLASSSDLVIVNIHWGTEYQHQFSKVQQDTGHELVDAGADIIIGHHPHVVQGFEIYKNRPIFYSLGNFIFDQYFSADTQEELAVGIEWNFNKEPTQPSLSLQSGGQVNKGREPESPTPPLKGEGEMTITLLPMKSKASQPELIDGKGKEKFLEKFISWSEVSDDLKKQIKEGRISL